MNKEEFDVIAAEMDEMLAEDNKKTDDMLNYAGYNKPDRVISSLEAQEEISRQAPKTIACLTHIKGIDDIADGYEPGELIVISGMQKNGKTTLAQTFTYNMAQAHVHPLWFSFEVSTHNFLKKFTNLPHFYIPRRIPKSIHPLQWIEQRIIESQVKYRTEVVFIDHLHYLIQLGQATNTSILIGAIMRELKKIAIDRNLVIFLLAHTQKLRIENVPDLADLRDSSFIAQESDGVMIIKRHGKIKEGSVVFENTAGLYYLANRRTGKLGHVELILENNLFREVTQAERTYL